MNKKAIKNNSSRTLVGVCGGREYPIKSGQTLILPRYVARHIHAKLKDVGVEMLGVFGVKTAPKIIANEAQESLEKLTVAKLKAMALAKGITLTAKLKAEIIKEIEASL